MYKKLLYIILGLVFSINIVFANINSKVERIINDFDINSSAVTVSVKDIQTGENIVKIRAHQPMIPASTQKLLTFPVVKETLGENYLFTTKLYKSDDNIYLKLSADPYFSTADIKKIVKFLSGNSILTCKEFYIDDSAIDSEEWGEGWQWDNDLNPLMPRYSAYNMDGNVLTVTIRPTRPDAPADVRLKEFYPVTFMNLVKTGNSDNVKMSRDNHISPDILKLEGTVKKQVTKTFPVNNPKRYFIMRLDEAIKDARFDYYGNFPSKMYETGTNSKLLGEISHSLNRAGNDILKNSNNLVAETVYKLAGGKFSNSIGTVEGANEMFMDYCKRNNLDTSEIRIVDGSGVSKNNIMTSDFMTTYLVNEAQKTDFNTLYTTMAKPSEGTLINRMLYLGDNLRAKTGTLSDVSAIAGYLTTQKGNKVAFDIMINDHKTANNKKKILEEQIIRTIYTNY